MEKKRYSDIDDYISDFPEDVTKKLIQMRSCIQEVAPNTQETISYNLPAFNQKKVFVYFAAFKNHIGL
jgi:uncharacterized protein YdhG (YjbR/CyaY superfamily)